jgi:NAD-dependent deacetylase
MVTAGRAANLRTVKRLPVLIGAGISTDFGIPDFRGPAGIWTKNPGAERLGRADSPVDPATLIARMA